MLKATMDVNGRTTLMLGLSFNNLNRFLAEPGNTFIQIDGKPMSLPIDVIIFSGETEAHLAEVIKDRIGPQTKVHIDPKLKS